MWAYTTQEEKRPMPEHVSMNSGKIRKDKNVSYHHHFFEQEQPISYMRYLLLRADYGLVFPAINQIFKGNE